MKKIIGFIIGLALCGGGLHAQTNSFVVPLGTNVVVQPAITVSSLTVQSVSFNFAAKRADIVVSANGTLKHYVVQGTAFATMVTNFQSQYGTPFAAYLQAHPPQ